MTLEQVRKRAAAQTFPRHVLEGCETGLVLFAAAFHTKRELAAAEKPKTVHVPSSDAASDHASELREVAVVDYAGPNLADAIRQPNRLMDFVAITVANLASFGIGEILNRYW